MAFLCHQLYLSLSFYPCWFLLDGLQTGSMFLGMFRGLTSFLCIVAARVGVILVVVEGDCSVFRSVASMGMAIT